MKETNIVQKCRMAAHEYSMQLFRNNTGSLEDKRGRWVQFGLCKGSGDLIGWKKVKITPDMVGDTVAIFTSVEVKRPGKKPTEVQDNFIKVVRENGGFAGFVTSPDELEKI